MDIILVCHTEFGYVKNRKVIYDKRRKEGVKKGVSNLLKLCDKYNIKATFALMPEVLHCVPQLNQHEIGLHVHPGWDQLKVGSDFFYVGDEYLKETCNFNRTSTILRDYSYEEQHEMIKIGKEYIFDQLKIEPKIFVAGRWSINNDSIKALINNGFSHDCSAAANQKSDHFDWSELPRISTPYKPNMNDYQIRGELPILIVPISQFFPIGNVNPEAIPSVGLSWLKACFQEYYNIRVPCFHICLHSPSMTDDCLIQKFDELLNFISRHKNIKFKFVSEINNIDHSIFNSQFRPYIKAINKTILSSIIKSRIFRKN